jgi:eukaryotic-like serine/threonine-protein kinase
MPEQETIGDYTGQQTRRVSPTATALRGLILSTVYLVTRTWDPLAPTGPGQYPGSLAPDRTVPLTEVLSRLKAVLADRYVIERELGSGGMATVYLAEDLRHHRQVAVKVLRPELAATLGPERFLQEIETAARFQHPHILPVHDSGEVSGFLYYVMPYVEGESLRTRLARQGELPIHDAVKILLEVTDALAYAHGRGVVHRDIKPDNVMLSGRHALVMDFGVAKAVSEATGRQQLTTAGVALGTPAYMAPEQAAAEPHLDHRVDLYALGAMGYELVAGRPPFTGRSSQEVLAAHMTQRPEPLCARRPACPPGLEAVIMRCLEKRPADRWQSADELLAHLEPLATRAAARPPRRPDLLKRSCALRGDPVGARGYQQL